MLTFRSAFVEEFKKVVEEKVALIMGDIAYGAGVPTFEAYREKVGEIRGLQTAIQLADEAEQNTDKRERGM